MSGAKCNKTMDVDRLLLFPRLPRRACNCLALLTHFAFAFARLQKRKKITPVMQATNWLKSGGPKGGFGQKMGFSSTKIGRQKRV